MDRGRHQGETSDFRHEVTFELDLRIRTLSSIQTMSSVNQTITYILFVTTILASTTAVISLIPGPPSGVGVGAFLVGAFAHPFIVLVIYRTILLRERASGDRIVGVERHLILFTTIGMITVLSTLAIREFSRSPSFQAQCSSLT